MSKRNILILGASYGSLLGTKLLMAGHRVTLVCTASTAELINREGTRVRFPVKERESGWSRSIRGSVPASCRRARRTRSTPAPSTWSCSACRRRNTPRRAYAS